MTLHATGWPKAHTKKTVTTATTASITSTDLGDPPAAPPAPAGTAGAATRHRGALGARRHAPRPRLLALAYLQAMGRLPP